MTKCSIWDDAALELLEHCCREGLTLGEMFDRFHMAGYGYSTVGIENKRTRARREHPDWRPVVEESPVTPLQSEVTLTGDALILADIHAPFQASDWLNRVIALALRWGISQAAVVGDAIDLAAFSPYGRQHWLEAETEIAAARQVFDVLGGNFAQVAYVGGNHEARMGRFTGCALQLVTMMQLWVTRKNVITSDYHWLRVVSGGQEWRCIHPRNVSVHATIVPKKLCVKYNANVIGAHGHLFGVTRDDSGRWWAVDSGMCADPQRLDYYIKEPNTRPVMLQGAVILQGGMPILLGPENIAWYEACKR